MHINSPATDGHLVDVAALVAPPYELAAYRLHGGGLEAFVHARMPTSTDRIETRVKMRHLQRKRAPLATSGRFRRPNRPETPQCASVSPGRRSRQRTTPVENRTEVQNHGEIDAHFLRNRPELAGTRPRAKPRQPPTLMRAQTAASKETHLHPLFTRTGSEKWARSAAARGSDARPSSSSTPRSTCGKSGRGSSSRKRAVHLHRLDSATLLNACHSLTIISAARQRPMRQDHMRTWRRRRRQTSQTSRVGNARNKHGPKMAASVQMRYLRHPQCASSICHRNLAAACMLAYIWLKWIQPNGTRRE